MLSSINWISSNHSQVVHFLDTGKKGRRLGVEESPCRQYSASVGAYVGGVSTNNDDVIFTYLSMDGCNGYRWRCWCSVLEWGKGLLDPGYYIFIVLVDEIMSPMSSSTPLFYIVFCQLFYKLFCHRRLNSDHLYHIRYWSIQNILYYLHCEWRPSFCSRNLSLTVASNTCSKFICARGYIVDFFCHGGGRNMILLGNRGNVE